MALITCKDCNNEVSTDAKTCPKCGAKIKPPKKPMSRTFKVLFTILGIGIVIATFATPKPQPASEKTPEQRAADSKRDSQLQLAVLGALSLKNSMKDPEAFTLTSSVVKNDGAACYEYRAKNGFGAIFPGSAMLTSKGKLLMQERDGNAFISAWNKECTAKGGDEILPFMKQRGII